MDEEPSRRTREREREREREGESARRGAMGDGRGRCIFSKYDVNSVASAA
jgi:hypothetical protein